MKLNSLFRKLLFVLFLFFLFPFGIFSAFIFLQVEKENEKEFRQHLQLAEFGFDTLEAQKLDLEIKFNNCIKVLWDNSWDNPKHVHGLGITWNYKKFLMEFCMKHNLDSLSILDENKLTFFEFKKKDSEIFHELRHTFFKAAKEGSLDSGLAGNANGIWLEVASPLKSHRALNKNYIIYLKKSLPENLFDSLLEITDTHFDLIFQNKKILTTRIKPGMKMDKSKRELGANFKLKPIAQTYFWYDKYLRKDTPSIKGTRFWYENARTDKQRLIIVKKLPEDLNPEMSLVLSVPPERVSQTGSILKGYAIFLIVFVLIISVCLGILTGQITKPLVKMSQLALAISKGDYEQVLPVNSNDEIGELAGSFNQMTRKLNRKMFEIETLFDVSRSMNFMNNSEQLLFLILDKALNALGAQRGSIMLFDTKENALEVKLIRSMDSAEAEERPTKILIKPGQGIAGRAFQTGQTIVSPGFSDDRFMKNVVSISGEERKELEGKSKDSPFVKVKSLVCSPLMVKEKAIGVINISNKIQKSYFDEDDAHLLEALASQVAMTIENTRLYELSITDGLTKLFIKRYFQFRLEEEINRASRYNIPLSLILLDIDHFKKFNDTYGHQVGDRVLSHFASIVKGSIRLNIDIPCRFGGEEFAVICPEIDADGAFLLGERIRKAVEDCDFPGAENDMLKVTTSIGISSFPGSASSSEKLVSQADIALYACKQAGRNRCQKFNPENKE
ncbi:diguanylate cyclase [Candidatus Riflebacteria bacterium]